MERMKAGHFVFSTCDPLFLNRTGQFRDDSLGCSFHSSSLPLCRSISSNG